MKKSTIMKKVITVIAITLAVTSIASMLSLAAPLNAIRENTAGYFKFNYNSKNGLPDDMVYDIATTSDGYIWLATASGLIRYDGEHFELINKNTVDSFPAVDVRCLFVDAKDRLWIGTADTSVICKTSVGYVQYGKSALEVSSAVKDIVQLNDGTIAVATSSGLYFVEEDGTVKPLENPKNEFIQASNLTVNTDAGTLICVTETAKIAVIKDKKLVRFDSYKQTLNGSITCMYYLGDGIFRTGMSNGTIIDADLSDNSKINEITTSIGAIKKMYVDTNGSCIVIGTQGTGSIDNKNSYSESKLFAKKNVNAICVDFQGNYWFALNGEGLLEMGKSLFFDVNEQYGLPDTPANCVVEFEGILYIGTNDGLLAVDEKTKKTVSNDFTAALTGKKVNDLKITTENRIVAATDTDGVYAYGGKLGLKNYSTNDHLIANHVNTICVMGDLYIGLGYNDGLSIDLSKKIKNKFDEETGVAGNVVKIYKSAATEDLLVGTENNGGYRITKDGKAIPFGKSKDGASSIIRAFLDNNNKNGVWIGYGPDLYYFESVTQGKKINKLNLTHSIIDLFHDDKGKLWIITSDKIIVANEDNLLDAEAELDAETLCKNDGLLSDISITAYNYMSDSGMLYLCTNNGVKRINTKDYKLSRTAPRLAINYINADGEAVSEENGVYTFSSDAETFEIGITAISFYIDRNYKLLYKLDDSGYVTSSLSDSNKIVYNKLAGGEHTVEIKLIDSDTNNVVSKKEIKIKKDYSVTEVKFFRIVMAFVIVLMIAPLLYLYMWYRIYRNKKKHKKSLAIAEQAMHSFAKVIDAKDPYTKGHSERVATYSVEIAKRYGLSEERLKDLYYSALLHDVGKVGIPDSILKKPSKLTQEEYELMKTHTTVGAEILKDMPIVKNIQYGARDHHEKYDGTGYPRGISGTLISFEGRVIGAADAYDAMTTLRGYNNTRTQEQTRQEIEELSGKQFDPEIAKIIIEMIDEGYFAPPEVNPESAEKHKKHRIGKKYKKNYRKRKQLEKSRADNGEAEETLKPSENKEE